MLITILVLSIINLIGFIVAGVLYFKEKFCIVSIEQWNELATIYNKVITAGLIDEEGNLVKDQEPIPELPGGYGFFKDELPEEIIEEEQ